MSKTNNNYLPENCVIITVHTLLSRKVFWHEYARIPRHANKNSIAAGNLE